MNRELCESARKGKVCPDDLCHSNPDNTLCGFDQSFYEEVTTRDSEDEYDAADTAYTEAFEEDER